MANVPAINMPVKLCLELDSAIRAALIELGWIPPSEDLPVSGASRKIGREWCRVKPGVQARLLSFGGVNEEAFAWIDVRPEVTGENVVPP